MTWGRVKKVVKTCNFSKKQWPERLYNGKSLCYSKTTHKRYGLLFRLQYRPLTCIVVCDIDCKEEICYSKQTKRTKR